MPLKIGASGIAAAYVGADAISRLYVGADLVFDAAPAPPGTWLLASGAWDDLGEWDDLAEWPAAGDATLLTEAQLTALGITTTRSGSQLSFPGRTALSAAGFEEVAANAPIFTPVQIGSEWFTALLPQAAATGLVTYSNRLDDAAWTKTNCTAEWVSDAGLATGGYTLVTATSANATVTRALTRSSANRRSLMLADVPAGNVGNVKFSQGTPTGATLYSDDFSSDTSGEWSRGANSVDGTYTVTGGLLVYTIGAGDGPNPRITRNVTGLTVGNHYLLKRTIGGTGTPSFSHPGATGVYTAGGALYSAIRPTATTVTLTLQVNGVVGATATLDNVSIFELDEPTLVTNFAETETAGAAEANPVLMLHLTNSGDTVKVYNWNHTEPAASTPVHRWLRPVAAVAESVGAATYSKTLSVAPTVVDIEILAQFPPVDGAYFAGQEDVTNRLWFLSRWGNRIRAQGIWAAGSWTALTSSVNKTPGDIIRIKFSLSASLASLTVNDETPITSVPTAALPSVVAFRLGDNRLGQFPLRAPLIASRDNNGQILGSANSGFNLSAITAFEATLP